MNSIISIFMLLFISTASFGGSTDMEIKTIGKTIILDPADWSKSEFEVLIKDVNGKIVYSQWYVNANIASSLKLNVDQFATGEYEVIVSNDLKIQKRSFNKLTDRIVINDAVTTFFKPQVKSNGSLVSVHFLNQEHKASIKIINPNNQVIFSEPINQTIYSKQISLSEEMNGEYHIQIVQGEYQYWKVIKLSK